MGTTRLSTDAGLRPVLDMAHAAATGERSSLLPLGAREAAGLVGATACEIWLAEEGMPQVAAVHLDPGASVESLDGQALVASLAGRTVEREGWLSVPIPGDQAPQGVLTLHKSEPWSAADQEAAELAAGLLGLGLMLAEARRFDEGERDQFLALIGHDLRSPLSNVRVGAQLAKRNLAAGDSESVSEALSIIEHQSGRLLDRLQALLDAVAASGRWLIRLQPLDLGAMAETAVAPFRLAADETGSLTRFEVVTEPDTPPARGDAGQIAQVLDRLIDNAAKYAAGGSIRIGVASAGTAVRLEVCDDGPGIRPEDVDRVFAPFGRGRNAAEKDGYGLGLYLARNIVRAHGGRLWIARTSRSGTCMAMTLPAARPEDA